MYPRKNYYLNDYFDLFNGGYSKEKEYMKTDIYEKSNNYNLEIDLPGIKKDKIKVIYENGYLTIKISKESLTSGINTYIRRERFFGEIKRSFYIGIKKENEIKSYFKDGVLFITFPKEDISEEIGKNIVVS